MKRLFTIILFFTANYLLSQTTVTLDCTGTAGSFNSGSVSASGVKNDGEIIGLNNGGGNRGWASFDLSTIPAGSVITSATISFTTYNSTTSSSLNDIYGFIGTPSSMPGTTLYASCGSGTSFNNNTWLANGSNTKSLNASGLSFLQNNFGGSVNLGFVRTSANTYTIYGYGNATALQPHLTITHNLPPCTGTPTGGTVSSTRDSLCDNVTSFTLSVTGATGGSLTGLSYQWQSSPNGTVWSDMGNGTGLTFTGTQSTTTYYRRKITCSGNAAYSSINIIVSNGAPIGGTVSGARYYCSPGQTIDLRVDGGSPLTGGRTCQWQKSIDGNVWVDISGAVNGNLNTIFNSETHFRRKIICGTSTAYSNSRHLKSGLVITPNYIELPGEGGACFTRIGSWIGLSTGSLTSPGIQLIGHRPYKLRYYKYLRGADGGYEGGEVFATTSLVFNGFGTSRSNATQYVVSGYEDINFTPDSSGIYYLKWNYQSVCTANCSGSASTPNATVGEISIKLSDPCISPLNIVVNNITTNSATISWNPAIIPGSDSVLNYRWYKSSENLEGFITDTVLNISGLLADSSYYYFISTNCATTPPTRSNYNIVPFRTLIIQDNCFGSLPITQTAYNESCNGILVNTQYAQPSPTPPTLDSADFDDDLWYKFTATSKNATFKFQNFSNTLGVSTGIVYVLYGDSCSALSTIAANFIPASFGVGESAVSGLTVGRTYYLRIATKGVGTRANFKFCVMVPAPNTFPVITGIGSSIVCAGSPITISGSDLTDATSVSIGGVSANSFTVVSATSINAVFITGASGNVSVTTPFGIAILDSISLSIKPSPLVTLLADCCVGGQLKAVSDGGIEQISWLYNGNIIQTVNGTWKANALTVAGGNGNGIAANQLAAPFGITKDAQGNTYVADANNHRIQKFPPNSTIGITVAGGNGAGNAANQLNTPRGVFVDAQGNIFIADANNNRVQKWLPNAVNGNTVAGGNGAGAAANQLDFPHGIFLDAQGNLYVADANNNRIEKWAVNAVSGTTVAGGNGAGSLANQLSYSTGVFVDAFNNVYVSDFTNNRIQKWPVGASTGTTVAGGNGQGNATNQLDGPRGVFVDCKGTVFVADQNNNRIQKWATGFSYGVTIGGGSGSGIALNQLTAPAAVYVTGSGKIVVADRSNNRVEEFSLPDTMSLTVASAGSYKAIITSTGCCDRSSLPTSINPIYGPNICPGSNTYFSSGSGAGNTYQWQVNTGTGYVNLANSSNYFGSNNDTITILQPPTSWYGYKYRCLVNGSSYSPEYALRFSVTWTGTSNTAWENPSNWNCGALPDENTDVIISNGLTNYPAVNVNAACGSLKLMPGTVVTVKTEMKLDVKRSN
ncbi:MAG: hypothetical protein ABIX01_13375 [Chitinophagaceae bacterium]